MYVCMFVCMYVCVFIYMFVEGHERLSLRMYFLLYIM
jgi:hypothetical protein